jgi:hypothetical protein
LVFDSERVADDAPQSPLLSAPLLSAPLFPSTKAKAVIKIAAVKPHKTHVTKHKRALGAADYRKEQNRLSAQKHRLIVKERERESETHMQMLNGRNEALRSMVDSLRDQIKLLKAALVSKRDRVAEE